MPGFQNLATHDCSARAAPLIQANSCPQGERHRAAEVIAAGGLNEGLDDSRSKGHTNNTAYGSMHRRLYST